MKKLVNIMVILFAISVFIGSSAIAEEDAMCNGYPTPQPNVENDYVTEENIISTNEVQGDSAMCKGYPTPQPNIDNNMIAEENTNISNELQKDLLATENVNNSAQTLTEQPSIPKKSYSVWIIGGIAIITVIAFIVWCNRRRRKI